MFKKIAVIASVLIVLSAVGFFLILSIGKPIQTDLTVIGQGKPVLVMAYQNHSPTGEALNRLRQIRGDYDSRLEFVVADMGTPEGIKFINHYQLSDGLAIFFAQDGQPIGVIRATEDEQELRRLLETKLAVLERNSESASE